jgi:glycerol uptake facilitator-like aquaporin
VWLYVLGPIIGGLGALLYESTIAKTESPKL